MKEDILEQLILFSIALLLIIVVTIPVIFSFAKSGKILMKTYKIDECLIQEIIDVLEKRRDELPCTTFHSNYIEKECQNSKTLIEKLKNLKRLKRFVFF